MKVLKLYGLQPGVDAISYGKQSVSFKNRR
nr:MAG TPA: hypothetical protein [Caudoviricetes sp.]